MSTLTHLTSKTGLIQLSIIAFFVIFLKLKDEEASVGDPAVVGDIGAGSSATSKVGL
jgi:hypothetical protein